MENQLDEYFNETYAYGKLVDFVREVFIGLEPAREKLSENLHFIATIQSIRFQNGKAPKALERNTSKVTR